MNKNVQVEIFEALTAAAISGVTQIRDTPKTQTSASDFPFIEIGAGQALPSDAGGDTGIEEYLDIHVYSRTNGQTQVKTIMQSIYNALHHTSLTVSGRTTAHCYFDSSRIVETPDGLTRHGIMTFQIIHRN